MTEIVLFHHIQGLTPGVRQIAERLEAAGHTVHAPDLYGGCTYDAMQDGLAHMQRIRDGIAATVDGIVADLPNEVVYLGISWGATHAQRLAQRRPGSRGAVLLEACIPVTGEWAFGPWPEGLPAQIHGMDADEFFALDGDLDAARELEASAVPGTVEVFTYPGDAHLFVDASLPSHDAAATELVLGRTEEFLSRV